MVCSSLLYEVNPSLADRYCDLWLAKYEPPMRGAVDEFRDSIMKSRSRPVKVPGFLRVYLHVGLLIEGVVTQKPQCSETLPVCRILPCRLLQHYASSRVDIHVPAALNPGLPCHAKYPERLLLRIVDPLRLKTPKSLNRCNSKFGAEYPSSWR